MMKTQNIMDGLSLYSLLVNNHWINCYEYWSTEFFMYTIHKKICWFFIIKFHSKEIVIV